MAQLVVRRLDEDVKLKLQRRARQHGRSTEEEVREILRAAVAVKDEGGVHAPLGSRFAAHFSGLGLSEEIRELPGQLAHPETVQMMLDEALVGEVDRAAQELGTTRSAFTHEALRVALARRNELELERRHHAGYAAKPVAPGEFDAWEDQQIWPD
jgi:antitoxin FitA